MAKPRKKHVQLELPKRDKNGQHRGGARKGLPTSRPQSWLLREGWKRGSGLISMRDVPGA